MLNRIICGLAAGAAGTLALNVAGYVDMLVRGRPASRLPAEVAGKVADEIGIPLDFDIEPGADEDDDSASNQRVASRQDALGALLGYVVGLQIGVSYSMVRLILPRPPTWLAGAALGSLAMYASDYPATRLGLTDPKSWSGADWAADVVPHMVYGMVTAATFEALRGSKHTKK
jgi:xanthosine utilization system XapX-like protein